MNPTTLEELIDNAVFDCHCDHSLFVPRRLKQKPRTVERFGIRNDGIHQRKSFDRKGIKCSCEQYPKAWLYLRFREMLGLKKGETNERTDD